MKFYNISFVLDNGDVIEMKGVPAKNPDNAMVDIWEMDELFFKENDSPRIVKIKHVKEVK